MSNELQDHEEGVSDDAAFGMLDQPRERTRHAKETTVKKVAILRRGNVWYHKAICFNKNVRVVISEEIYEWMEEHAVDFVSSEDQEVTGKAKFEYRDYDGDAPVGTALDAFEDLQDDKLRRKEAYREPYRPPQKRVRPLRAAHSVEHEDVPVTARTRTRVR